MTQAWQDPLQAEDVGRKPRLAPPLLRGLVLLTGGMLPTPLELVCGRPPLSMPVASHPTLLDHWLAHAHELPHTLRTRDFALHVVGDVRGAEQASSTGPVQLHQDPGEARGPGGALADFVRTFEDEDRLLVVTGHWLLHASLTRLCLRLQQAGGDAALLMQGGREFAGLMLITCRSLRHVPAVGYCDLKEQWLPRLTSSCRVMGVAIREKLMNPMRTAGQYLSALALAKPGGSIVEDEARVAPTALLQDAVALRGSVIEEQAVVARSLVCQGAVVCGGDEVVDAVVTPQGVVPIAAPWRWLEGGMP